ncbi:MAG: DUF433 domain-containing protein [Bacteroidota bacterium]|nr:DUF433 domain-containing protein [Bacteroidota bacterium]
MSFEKYIEINPGIRFGKPVIIGTRIAVLDVQQWIIEGMTADDIISDFPELNADQIKACLDYPDTTV